MTFINLVIGRALDLLLAPFEALPPIVGLAALALLTAVPMLLVYRAVSDQQRIRAVKRAMAGALFEIRLFNDDLSAVFRAQGELLRHNFTYLRMALVPMLWLVVPIGLLVAHLEYRFGYAGPHPGQAVLVKAQLRDAAAPGRDGADVTLKASPPVQVLTPAVWFPSTGEVLWQVAADRPGDYQLEVRVGSEVAEKSFSVEKPIARRSPVRSVGTLASQLAYPAEAPLAQQQSLTSIQVAYEQAAIRVLGFELPWMAAYFVLTLVFAVALRKPLRVAI